MKSIAVLVLVAVSTVTASPELESEYRKQIDEKVEELIAELQSLFANSDKWPQETLDAINKLHTEPLFDWNELKNPKKRQAGLAGIGKMLDSSVPLNMVKGLLSGSPIETISHELESLVTNLQRVIGGSPAKDSAAAGPGSAEEGLRQPEVDTAARLEEVAQEYGQFDNNDLPDEGAPNFDSMFSPLTQFGKGGPSEADLLKIMEKIENNERIIAI